MSRGEYLSLEEARKMGLLERFAKEHPTEGEEGAFDRLMASMASGKPVSEVQTSTPETSED